MRSELEKLTKDELIEMIINFRNNLGRKQILNEQDKESIKMYRLQGKSLREIAKIFNVSKSLIHNITK